MRAPLAAAHGLGRSTDMFERQRHVLMIAPTFLGQLHPLVFTPEQGRSHRRLKLLHGVTDGRLGHIEFLRRLGETGKTPRGLENDQGIQGWQLHTQ